MKRVFRYLFVLLALASLFSLFILPVSAEENESEAYIEWEMSWDHTKISNEEQTYYLFELPVGYQRDFVGYYRYQNGVKDRGGYSWDVMSYERHGEYLFTHFKPNYYVYATQKGLNALRAFIEEEEYHYYRVAWSGTYLDVDANFFEGLNAERSGARKITVSVSELREADCYELVVYDEFDQISYVYGAIWEYEGEYWYVNYDELPNNYFDANGGFSYRSGSVELSRISNKTEGVITNAEADWSVRDGDYVYESDDLGDDINVALPFFFMAYIPGILFAPIPFLVLGLIWGKKKEQGSNRYWYIVAALAAAWFLLALAVLLILL